MESAHPKYLSYTCDSIAPIFGEFADNCKTHNPTWEDIVLSLKYRQCLNSLAVRLHMHHNFGRPGLEWFGSVNNYHKLHWFQDRRGHAVLGVVLNVRPNFQVLSPALPLFWHNTDYDMHQNMARHFGADLSIWTSLPSLALRMTLFRSYITRNHTSLDGASDGLVDTWLCTCRRLFFRSSLSSTAGDNQHVPSLIWLWHQTMKFWCNQLTSPRCDSCGDNGPVRIWQFGILRQLSSHRDRCLEI